MLEGGAVGNSRQLVGIDHAAVEHGGQHLLTLQEDAVLLRVATHTGVQSGKLLIIVLILTLEENE